MNGLYAAAAVGAAMICGGHVVIGGRTAARPLLASGLEPSAKFAVYYCWHLVTVTIVALAAAFAWSACHENASEVALLATVVSFSFALWNLAMVWRFRLPLGQFYQWALFLPIAVFGLIGSLR